METKNNVGDVNSTSPPNCKMEDIKRMGVVLVRDEDDRVICGSRDGIRSIAEKEAISKAQELGYKGDINEKS